MSVEANKALVRRFLEEVWQGNQAIYEESYTANATVKGVDGVEGLRSTLNSIRGAISDLTFGIDELIAEEDTAVARWTLKGTHTGDLLGSAPTNEPITMTGISIYHIADGKIVDDWYEGSMD